MRTTCLALFLTSACLALQSVQPEVMKVSSNDEQWKAIWQGCSLHCAVNWQMAASSQLAAQGANTYGAEKSADAKAGTAWVEGAKGAGVGEWLECRIAKDPRANGVPLSGVTLVAGYAKTPRIWEENSRPKTLEMSLDGEPVAALHLQDVMYPQSFALKDLKIKSESKIRFTVKDVYPGSKYEDTAITELILDGAH